MQPTIVRRLRESGKKRLFIVPFLFTFANACLGLISVIYAIDDCYTIAAYCIVAAAIFDCLDGRLARALGSGSLLGTELDSLCDAISFCFAPAILLYSKYFYDDAILGPIAVGLFLCAGLFRLAKFNSRNTDYGEAFIGMPTTCAALFVALFAIHDQWLLAGRWCRLVSSSYAMMLLVVGISWLMISTVRFPAFKNRIHDLLSITVIGIMGIAVIFAWFNGIPLLLMMLAAYSLTAIICHILACIGNHLIREHP